MILTLKRVWQGKNSTLSKLDVDGLFFCFGLEDRVRQKKINGITAIPVGTYRLKLNTHGAMNTRYQQRFPTLHEGMVEIMNIPGFSDVYIHIGNYHSDTAGCLLVGDYYKYPYQEDYAVFDSAKAYRRLYQHILGAVKRGNAILTIITV